MQPALSPRRQSFSPVLKAFSCVVSDLRMPGVDGLGLQDALRSQSQHLPMAFVTGDAHVPDTVKAMRGGAADFSEKPVTNHVLMEAIGNWP